MRSVVGFESVEFAGRVVGGPENCGVAGLLVLSESGTGFLDQPLHTSVAERDGRRIHRAIIDGENGDRLSIGRKDRVADGAVEFSGEIARFSTSGRHDGEVAAAVLLILRLAAVDVGDELAVGAPGGRAFVGAGKGGELARGGVGRGGDDEDIGVDGAVGIGIVIADEGDLGAIGRPDGVVFLEVLVGGQLVELLALDVVEIEQVGAAVGRDVALDVLLEAIAVDDDGLGLLFVFVVLALFFFGFGLEVFGDGEQQFFRIRRPFVGGEISLYLGQLASFATAPVEHPDLAALHLGRAGAFGEERDVFAVGTPARLADGAIDAVGEANVLRAVPAHHPQIGDALVGRGVDAAYRIQHPLAVGRDLRRADAEQMVEIVEVQRMRPGLCCGRRRSARRVALSERQRRK